jgi:hypothetical protein
MIALRHLTGDRVDTETQAFLDPPETSVRYSQPDLPVPPEDDINRCSLGGVFGDNLAQVFRHSGWANDRRRVYHALLRTMQSENRVTAFADCGAKAYVYRSLDDPDVYRVSGSTCRDRFCLPCTRERGQTIAANVSERLAGKTARFLTLTLRTQDEGLADAIARLQHAFRRLQRTPLWQGRVDGGVAFVETKYNPAPNRWHPHIHAIVQGRYLPHDQIAATWKRITGDSHIVRIELVRSREKVLRYVTTYCSKALRVRDFPTDAALHEAIIALHRRRLCRTFGTWRGAALTEPHTEGTWELVGELDQLLRDAADGDFDARRAVASLNLAPARQFLLDHPPEPPPQPETSPITGGHQLLLPTDHFIGQDL